MSRLKRGGRIPTSTQASPPVWDAATCVREQQGEAMVYVRPVSLLETYKAASVVNQGDGRGSRRVGVVFEALL